MRLFIAFWVCVFWPLIALAQTPPAAPIVTIEVTPEAVSVGQPVKVRVTLLVPTWMPSAAVFPSFEIPNVIVRLPSRATSPTSKTVNGETWSGIIRTYRMYPMLSGDFALPEQQIDVTYANPADSTNISVSVALPPVRFTAIVPMGAEELDPLIVADSFELEQVFEGPEQTLTQGDAVIRSVTAKIGGSSALFIPPLIDPLENDAVQVYPKDGALRETEDRGVLSGTRVDSTTYVAQFGGVLDLPDITVQWFNTQSNVVETVTLDGQSYQIDAPAPPRKPWLTRQQKVVLGGGIIVLLLIVWVVRRYIWGTLLGWRHALKKRYLTSEAYAAKQVYAAISAQDASALRNTLGLWSGLMAATGGGEDLALEQSVLVLGAARFGVGATGNADWSAVRHAFATARKVRRANGTHRHKGDSLPPLNPF